MIFLEWKVIEWRQKIKNEVKELYTNKKKDQMFCLDLKKALKNFFYLTQWNSTRKYVRPDRNK